MRGRDGDNVVEFAHEPVLAQEVLHYLAPQPGGVYCDATVGGGGHARLIVTASAPDGRLVGIDRDPAAIEAARQHLAEFGERVTLVHGRFGDVAEILHALGVVPLSGIVIDVGVSSPQLDWAERGFSFAKDGPLDMRMDTSRGETALDLVTRTSVEQLAGILRDYGEERHSMRIARAIKEAVRNGAMRTTGELRSVVVRALNDSQTARQTRALHIIPRATAGTNSRPAFASPIVSAVSPTLPLPNMY